MKEFTIMNIRVDDLSDTELTDTLSEWLKGDKQRIIVTPNPEFLLQAKTDHQFRTCLNKADLSLVDGVALRYAVAALTDQFLQNRHTGVDALKLLAKLCANQNQVLCLLGGAPGAGEKTAEVFIESFPNLKVVSIDPGHIEKNEDLDPDLIMQINNHHPAVLAVALGQGKQEWFMKEFINQFPDLKIAIGIGGALDSTSGTLPPPPAWLKKAGLEFLWRLKIQPKRIRRIFNASIIFPITIALISIKQKRFIKACSRVFPEVFRQLRGL